MAVANARWEPPNATKIMARNLKNAPTWMPVRIRKTARWLGHHGVDAMRDAVDVNRYTGKLGRSISATYEDNGYTVKISPKVMRGKWDGGLLLEFGTRPIPRAPWSPIAKWAAFRGLPAFPVWYRIRERGVLPHPFVNRTSIYMTSYIEVALNAIIEESLGFIFKGL